jgi:glucan phosphorylase
MFYQKIKDGNQIEFPDYWLIHGNPWEIERMDVVYPIKFYGTVHEVIDADGRKRVRTSLSLTSLSLSKYIYICDVHRSTSGKAAKR